MERIAVVELIQRPNVETLWEEHGKMGVCCDERM